MSKALLFDMDGTIADLYSVENWLPKLRAEDVSPYRDAKPMYDMDLLNEVLKCLRCEGYRVVVVSWGAMGASAEYGKAVRKAKIRWLQDYGFPFDEVHIVKYGTPKANFIKDDTAILIDDNQKVRDDFMNSTKGNKKAVVDATKNIMKSLVDLLLAEV